MTPRNGLRALCLIALTTIPTRAQDPAAIKTVSFEAPSVGRTLKYNVALPADYETSGKSYPVVYLLHGLTSNYLAWGKMGAGKAAKDHDLIVVMADAGNSWYVNWAEPEGEKPNRWEDCIVIDLIGHVDKTYRTVARREGRAINGLSMGGYGAVMLGLRHPDLFCSAGSESGALSIARQAAAMLKSGAEMPKRKRELSDDPNKEIGVEGFSSQLERTPKGKMFSSPEQAEGYDPFHLIETVPREKLPHLIIDCGTEDRLLGASQEFAKLLMDKKIPFTFAESPGGHAPAYWVREITPALAVQAIILKRNLATIQAATP